MLNYLSILSDLLGVHSWIGSIKQGKFQQQILGEISRLGGKVERLSDHILYAGSIQQIRDITKVEQDELVDKRRIRELLDPLQKSIGDDILSTAIISTPDKLHSAFRRQPREIFFSITPLDKVEVPDNPNVIPVLFVQKGIYYVGWQMKGALPSLFDCKYFPEQNFFVSQKQSNLFGRYRIVTDECGDALYGDAQSSKLDEIDSLIRALKDKDNPTFMMSSFIEAAGQFIRNPFQSKKEIDSKTYAILQLVNIGESAIGPLIHAMKDKNARYHAILALQKIGEPAIKPLVDALRDNDARVSAIMALVEIGEPSVKPLIDALKSANKHVRVSAIMALKKIGRPAIAPLMEGVKDKRIQIEVKYALKLIRSQLSKHTKDDLN